MYGTSPITVGVLFVGNDPVQMGDIVTADIIGMVDPDYLSVLPPYADPLKALGTPIKFVYISESGVGPFKLSGGASVSIQSSVVDAPKLDILVVPGPSPSYKASEVIETFIIKTHASGATILCICTGILAIAGSGILDGKVATGPLGILPGLRKSFPAIEWKGTRRWEKVEGKGANTGEIWTSGGVFNGEDLGIAFFKEKFAKPLAEALLGNAGAIERPVEYSEEEIEAARRVWGV